MLITLSQDLDLAKVKVEGARTELVRDQCFIEGFCMGGRNNKMVQR